MNRIPDNRQYPRRSAFIIAEYKLKEGAYRDFIKNISADGLFVRTWRKFVAGESIVLKFPLFQFDNTIQVSGKVVRNDQDGFAVTFDEPIDGLICKEGHLPEIVNEGDR
ncbi:MAG: PilZ domain-containing protein [Desulfosarcina sp.]|nr:PilZ domain-containing protein [Desulfosarcina sp.]